MSRFTQRVRIVGAILIVLLFAGCTTETRVPDQAFIDKTRGWLENIDRSGPFYRHIEDLLPNRHYRRESGSALDPLSVRVVVGEFVDASPGVGSLGTGKAVAYDDKRALWHTIHAEFRVDESLGGDGPPRVTVGWPSNGSDIAEIRAGLISLGRTVLFLRPSPVYDYEEDVLAILEDGAFIATVSLDGELALPLIGDPRQSELLERTGTLSELRAEARRPSRTIVVQETDGILEPVP